MKFRNFLGLAIVASALLPLLTISALLMDRQNQFMTQSMNQELKRVLQGMSLDIEYKFSTLSTNLKHFSREAYLTEAMDNFISVGRARKELAQFVEQSPLVTSIYLLTDELVLVEQFQGNIRALEHSELKRDLVSRVGTPFFETELQRLLPFNDSTLLPSVKGEVGGFAHSTQGFALISPVYLNSYHQGLSKQPRGYLLAIIPAVELYRVIEPGLAEGEALKILGQKDLELAISATIMADEFKPENHVSLIRRSVLSSENLVNRFNYSLLLYANQSFRMQQLESIYSALSFSLALTIVLSLFAAAWFIRGIRHHFHLLSKTLARFSQGKYETSAQKMPFQEFEEVQQILLSMGSTIRQQVSDLQGKNRELQRVDQLREQYLNEVKLLNGRLEQRVSEQTQEIRKSLDKEESLRFLLHGLLDLSIQLQRHDDLLAMVQECLEKLSRLLAGVPVGVYINGCNHCEQRFEHHGIDPMLARRLKSDLTQYDFKGVEALPHVSCLGESCFSLFGLASRNGRMLGALVVQSEQMDSESLAVFKLFAKQVSAVIETVQLTSELELLVRTDELTSFPNRKAFNESLKHSSHLYKRYPERHIGIFVIDANGLKRVNDDYGHDAGDHLICMLGCILSRTCRQSDQVFRLGGDEFAILVEQGDQQSCDKLFARLTEEQGSHYLSVVTRDEKEIAIELAFSVGFATTELHQVDELFKVADQHMYRQKQAYYHDKGQAATTRFG